MDKCKFCDADAEFKCLVEGEEDWTKSETIDVCSEHMENVKAGLIEVWTKAEWLAMEQV